MIRRPAVAPANGWCKRARPQGSRAAHRKRRDGNRFGANTSGRFHRSSRSTGETKEAHGAVGAAATRQRRRSRQQHGLANYPPPSRDGVPHETCTPPDDVLSGQWRGWHYRGFGRPSARCRIQSCAYASGQSADFRPSETLRLSSLHVNKYVKVIMLSAAK